MNAGIITDGFTPSTGVVGNILGATNNGITFQPNPTYEDFGADIDNVPPNTWQMKRLVSYDPALSGSFRTMTPSLLGMLSGAGELSSGHFVPSHQLTQANFTDVWVIGDYSDKNIGVGTAGYIAVHVKNALNVNGFRWKSNKDGKGEFDFEYHGHYDLTNIDDVPFEVYIKSGTATDTVIDTETEPENP